MSLLSFVAQFLVLATHLQTTISPAPPLMPASKAKPSTPLPFTAVVINTLEGVTYALHVIDGSPVWKLKTGPPLISSTFRVGGGVGIVPGVDGSLFALNSNGLQRFPVTTHDLLQGSYLIDDVVASSSSLLIGNKRSKMFAVQTETGTIVEAQDTAGEDADYFEGQYDGTSNSNSNSNSKTNTPLLLHRVEYTVRNVDTRTGKETWNATVAEMDVVYEVAPKKHTNNEHQGTDDGPAQNTSCAHSMASHYVVECTHDGVIRLLSSSSVLRSEESEPEPEPEQEFYLMWDTKIAAHPQSCHVVSTECGVVSSYDVYLDRRTVEEKERDHIHTQLAANPLTRSTSFTNDVGASASPHGLPYSTSPASATNTGTSSPGTSSSTTPGTTNAALTSLTRSSLVTQGEHHRWYLGRLGGDDHVFAAPLNSNSDRRRTLSTPLPSAVTNDKAVVAHSVGTNADGTVVSVGGMGDLNKGAFVEAIEWFPVEMHQATGVSVRAANHKDRAASFPPDTASMLSSSTSSHMHRRERGRRRGVGFTNNGFHDLEKGEFVRAGTDLFDREMEEINIDNPDYSSDGYQEEFEDQFVPPHLQVPEAVKSFMQRRPSRMRSEITDTGIVLSWRGVCALVTGILLVRVFLFFCFFVFLFFCFCCPIYRPID